MGQPLQQDLDSDHWIEGEHADHLTTTTTTTTAQMLEYEQLEQKI